jgi:hypothetical protein
MAASRKRFWMCESFTPCMKVRLVALKAEKGFVLFEQIVGHCAVGIMANGAIFDNRCMFIDKRPLLICMAIEAKVVNPFDRFQVFDQ